MWRPFRRVRTTIHPDRALLRLPFIVLVPRDDFLRARVLFFPDAHIPDGVAHVGSKRDALPFGNGIDGGRPTLCLHTRFGVNRESSELADLLPGTPPRLILV